MMSQYEAQQMLKKSGVNANGSIGGSSLGLNESDLKKKYHVPGMGYYENEPLVETDENGQRVVTTAGVTREGNIGPNGNVVYGPRLSKAYDYAKTGLGDLIRRWQASRLAGLASGDGDLRRLYDQYRAEGLYTGGIDGFENWLNARLRAAENESLKWKGFRGRAMDWTRTPEKVFGTGSFGG